VGGLHIHILKNILQLIIKIIFEFALLFNFNINGSFLKFGGYFQLFFIGLYGFINGSNSWSVPTLRGSASYILYNIFYLRETVINHLWIFLIVIWGFLMINVNYIYDLGFQMSFLSVYFLMGLSVFLYKTHKYF
jgi:hypothetical protein